RTMVTNVTFALNKIMRESESVKMTSIDQIGPFRMGTLTKQNISADIAVTIGMVPLKQVNLAQGNRILAEVKILDLTTSYHLQLTGNLLQITNTKTQDKITLHILTSVIRHVNTMLASREAIQHSQWFDEMVKPYQSVTNLIIIITDMA